jgi:hypothetical protein
VDLFYPINNQFKMMIIRRVIQAPVYINVVKMINEVVHQEEHDMTTASQQGLSPASGRA